MKKISVIIPVYNAEKTLERCIDSVLKQDHRDLEVIVIDDGSTDNSPYLCDLYTNKDKRVITVHQENGGVCKARNAGLALATGDYITFLDNDDYLKDHAYSTMIDYLENNVADICLCHFLNGNLQDTISSVPNAPKLPAGIYDSYEIENYLYAGNWYLNGLACAIWNKLYPRKLIKDFRFSGLWGEDYELNDYIFSKHVRVMVIEEGLTVWCYNPQSQTHKKYNPKWNGFLFVLKKRSELFADDENIEYETKKLFCEKYIEYYIASIINKYEPPKEYYTQYIKYANDLIKSKRPKLKWKFRMIVFRQSPKLYYLLTKKNWEHFALNE